MGLDHEIDDTDEDEEPYLLDDQEDWYSSTKTRKTKVYRPYSKTFLEALKKARTTEIRCQAVAAELFTYLMFLVIIFLISYGNRDPDSYILKNHMEQRIMYKNNFHKVTFFLFLHSK